MAAVCPPINVMIMVRKLQNYYDALSVSVGVPESLTWSVPYRIPCSYVIARYYINHV